jgi:hypothetical protein
MKGKIIQYIKRQEYEAVVTDEGVIYERILNRIEHPSIYRAYSYEWSQWVEKTIKI